MRARKQCARACLVLTPRRQLSGYAFLVHAWLEESRLEDSIAIGVYLEIMEWSRLEAGCRVLDIHDTEVHDQNVVFPE